MESVEEGVRPTSSLTERSFDDRFDALAALAYRVAYRLLGSREDAEDVAQEAMVRAYARWRGVHPHAEPWVTRVAANLALDALRRAKRRPTSPAETEPPAPPLAPSPALDRIELVRLLEGLPRRQREVVVLRFLGDLTEVDTARELGTSVGSVKQHAHRGLAALRGARAELDADVPDLLTNRGGA